VIIKITHIVCTDKIEEKLGSGTLKNDFEIEAVEEKA
jgi:hypothetical protein